MSSDSPRVLPGAAFRDALFASLRRLGPEWSIGTPEADEGLSLDDAGSLLLCGPDLLRVDVAAEVVVLTEALAVARAGIAAAIAAVATPAEGERALPTTLGGPAVWARVCSEAATVSVGVPDAHAVVVVRTDATRDRTVERVAAALTRSVRAHDVVCLLDPGVFAVLALCWPRQPVVGLADRLVAALLDVGVGAAAGAAVDGDPRRAEPGASARAERAWAARQVLQL
jgi:hypothetical protein